ncbi:hypothetical protein AHOG_12870 [Actinoalloteichus hoggarensis]|uniref:Uncharacterized protein n=1 Tax=Actinoalloteichus hoggarensis TaxID=1470176 RepID=A0A221W3I8_9PSEU|nr:hypothetical protein AHOG_12870 [Actinoalloteichus hoggarensis]
MTTGRPQGVRVVGASGRLGRHLVRQSSGRGYEVVGLCREPAATSSPRSPIGSRSSRRGERSGGDRRAVAGCDGVRTALVPGECGSTPQARPRSCRTTPSPTPGRSSSVAGTSPEATVAVHPAFRGAGPGRRLAGAAAAGAGRRRSGGGGRRLRRDHGDRGPRRRPGGGRESRPARGASPRRRSGPGGRPDPPRRLRVVHDDRAHRRLARRSGARRRRTTLAQRTGSRERHPDGETGPRAGGRRRGPKRTPPRRSRWRRCRSPREEDGDRCRRRIADTAFLTGSSASRHAEIDRAVRDRGDECPRRRAGPGGLPTTPVEPRGSSASWSSRRPGTAPRLGLGPTGSCQETTECCESRGFVWTRSVSPRIGVEPMESNRLMLGSLAR